MKNISIVGKFLFALPLLGFGFGHFANAAMMSGMVPAFLPFPVIWVYLTGIALILAVVSILINKKTKLALSLLGLMLILFAFMIHLPSMMAGNEMSMPMFLKDLSMGGAAWWISSQVKN